MSFAKRLTAVVLSALLLFTAPALASDNKALQQSNSAYIFSQITDFVMDFYNFDITKDELLSRTIQNLLNTNPKALDDFTRALLNSLDEYSQFYTPEEWEAFQNQLEGVFGGIGVQISTHGNDVTVISVVSYSPAQKAGIKSGDRIIEVNGESVIGIDHNAVSQKIKGDIGTTVQIKVMRDGQALSFDIVRAEIKNPTVAYKVVAPGVGYIQLKTFNSSTVEEFNSALSALDSKGVKKIILDLRYNPGGYMEVAVDIAKKLVPAGKIVTASYKHEDKKESYSSNLSKPKYELLVLVNEYTASAAEILSSAIQESKAGKLIGERTYGKAVIQQTFPLYSGPDGTRWCKITVGTYLTRGGNQINKIGIVPDYSIRNRTVKYDDVEKEKMVYSQKYALGDAGKGILAAKQRLSVLGYDVGDADERFTEEMQTAVAQFQADYKLFPYGVLDLNTQILLENVACEKDVVLDEQMDTALELFGVKTNGNTLE